MNYALNILSYNRIEYHQTQEDKTTWTGYADELANSCLAPVQWLFGCKKFTYLQFPDANINFNFSASDNEHTPFMSIVSKIAGVILFIPGFLLSIPLKAFAQTSEEIYLKHKIILRNSTEEEIAKLQELIQQRRDLQDDRDGCEPISCLLLTIVCTLCIIMQKSPTPPPAIFVQQ